MATVTKTGVREVTIATTSTVIVGVYRALPNYTLDTFIASFNITSTDTVTYDEDGIYIIAVTETVGLEDTVYYIDVCVEDIYNHLKADVLDILNNPVTDDNDTFVKYDFISLVLLGLAFLGNTSYSLSSQDGIWSTLPADLQKIEDAIVRSKVYIELNGSNSQAVTV